MRDSLFAFWAPILMSSNAKAWSAPLQKKLCRTKALPNVTFLAYGAVLLPDDTKPQRERKFLILGYDYVT